jgi:hypothetical protein
MFGYGTRVITPAGRGMIVGATTRTYRVLMDGSGGRTNHGRHFGEGVERGWPFHLVSRESAATREPRKEG